MWSSIRPAVDLSKSAGPASLLAEAPPPQFADTEATGHRALVSPAAEALSPKILLYSHDTFGFGNISRTLLLSQELADQFPRATILIVTGSPMIHAFRIPERVDYIKLPCLNRVAEDRYAPRLVAGCADEVWRTRKAILTRSVIGFRPDLMIVDKRPAGVDGELLEALHGVRRASRGVKLVLGVRDILDEPDRTRRSLKTSRFFENIKRYYDEIWIYGMRAIFDPIDAYRFPATVARKTHFCGYLRRPTTPAFPHHEEAPKQVVVTPGGGDGSSMIAAYLQGLAGLPRRLALRTTVVFGPEMPADRRTTLRERFDFLADVTFVDFDPDLRQRFAAADVVVSRAGYNTVCELLSSGTRAVLVPRSMPVREQLLRAQIFARLGYFQILEPHELDPQRLMVKVLQVLEQTNVAQTPVDLGGLWRVRQRVRALLEVQTLRAGAHTSA